jgi:hypothetical protein
MSFDNDLKQAFKRHSGDVSPTPGAWTGVERRIRRSHRIRAALATAGGAAAIVAAVVVVPSVLNKPGLTPQPPATEGPTSPPVSEDTSVFRNERDGYWLQYPKDWRFGEFEAHVSFQPPGLPGIEEGGETFAAELWVDAGRFDDAERTGSGSRDATIAGRPAKVVETGYGCPKNGPCPVASPSVLIVTLQATLSDEPLWDRYGDLAIKLAESIRLNNASTTPTENDVKTRRGAVAAGVPYDSATSSVVRFMEARIEAGGAEPWITSNAKQQYDRHEGRLSLYSPDEKTSYVSYRLVSRAGVDANSFEYVVQISYIKVVGGGTSEERWNFQETLGVGPGTNAQGKSEPGDALIRFATRGTDALEVQQR